MSIGFRGFGQLFISATIASISAHVHSQDLKNATGHEVSEEWFFAAETLDWGRQQQWIRLGKKAVRAKLKDPESAKFKDVYFYQGKDNVPVTCGLVNAKNSFGGYSGFEHFVSAGSVDLTYLESEVKDFGVIWNRLCTK